MLNRSHSSEQVRSRASALQKCWLTFKTMKYHHLGVLGSAVLAGVLVTVVVSQQSNTVQRNKLPETKIIIDTDVGIDDAVALFYLLRAEKYSIEDNISPMKILAITCVHGNTIVENVIINVLKVLNAVDRLDIPVHRGTGKSFTFTPDKSDFFGDDGMGDVPSSFVPDPALLNRTHAVTALMELVDENPGEITILALGPLTNIALAARMDDNFLRKVKKILILGGCVEGKGNILPGVEYNFFVDPDAVHVIFNGTQSNPHSLVLLPWEVALGATVTNHWRKTVLGALQSPEAKFINAIEHLENMTDEGMWVQADPIAAAVLLAEEVMMGRREYYSAAVVLSGPTRGGLAVDYDDLLKSETKLDILYNLNSTAYMESLIEHFK